MLKYIEIIFGRILIDCVTKAFKIGVLIGSAILSGNLDEFIDNSVPSFILLRFMALIICSFYFLICVAFPLPSSLSFAKSSNAEEKSCRDKREVRKEVCM